MSTILLPYTRGCFVCGAENPVGLRLRFRVEGGEVCADFEPDSRHEGYRGVIHGGVIASALDEVMFWAVSYANRKFYVSVELAVRYQKKVEVGKQYCLVGRVRQAQRRICVAEGELRDRDGEIYATASGKFFPMTLDRVPLGHEDFYPDPLTLSPSEFFKEV